MTVPAVPDGENGEPRHDLTDAALRRAGWYSVECEHGYDFCPTCDAALLERARSMSEPSS